ncbi:hypothetical protein [Arenibaculum pallidiluteum]|uniref:hypothetical protein n=1 Tax=Arenibaculum pallidiluteum TaxID=2812559 RepID=UPI001A96A7D8|nr:hypothetical protein [Arenibaculum pallidiluteum]
MAVIYVARSANLTKWASDVGLGKHVYKVGVAEEPVKPLIETGWAGETDWTLVKKQEVEGLTEEQALERLAAKVKPVDPFYYPRIKGAAGIFRVPQANVENHLLVARAMAGAEELVPPKVKAADFAAYLIKSAIPG